MHRILTFFRVKAPFLRFENVNGNLSLSHQKGITIRIEKKSFKMFSFHFFHADPASRNKKKGSRLFNMQSACKVIIISHRLKRIEREADSLKILSFNWSRSTIKMQFLRFWMFLGKDYSNISDYISIFNYL